MYGNPDHSIKRVIQEDEADGPDGDTKGYSSWPIDDYTYSTNFIGEDQGSSKWRSQVAIIQGTSESWVEVRHADPCRWNAPFR